VEQTQESDTAALTILQIMELRFISFAEMKKRGLEAIDQIKSSSKNNNVYLHVCDLGEMNQIRNFVKDFVEKGNHLDILVNNAGSMLCGNEIEYTRDGIEKTFAINTLGTFLLTNLLIPTLRKSSDPRVIVTSSGGMLTQNLLIRDEYLKMPLWYYDPMVTYARTKRQLVALVEYWSQRFHNYGIKFFAMHPGIVDTKALSTGMPKFYALTHFKQRTWEEGADTINWLAVSDSVPQSGLFFRDRKPEIKHGKFAGTEYTDEERTALWNWCCELSKWSESEIREYQSS